MSETPSYQLARDERKGSGTMTIEPKSPSQGKVIESEPHNEILDLPDKTGRTTQGGIGEIPSVATKTPSKLENIPTHPGEYARSSKYSPVSKT